MVTAALGFGLVVGLLAHHHAAEAAVLNARMPAYSTFSYTQMTSDRYPTPLKPHLSFPTPFAPPFSKASTLLPSNVTYTTYSLDPTATLTADGKYGQSAYAALWTGYHYSESPPFTTTVSPIPVPTQELVFPPDLPVQPVCENNLKLPADFIWGHAGSAWQIEGGLQLEGRGPSTLDVIGAVGSAAVLNDSTGLAFLSILNVITGSTSANDSNVADMNYLLYKQDFARLAAMGVPYYSFSIAWPRVVPFGVADSPVNTQALEHYEDLINTCLEYGITPIVTLSHFDLPSSVNPDDPDFVTHYMYYAKQVMIRYGDRVPYWVTFNEPNSAYGIQINTFNGLTNFLVAHATLFDWYKNELGGKGQITIKFANNLGVPSNPSNPSDVSAALRYQDFAMGIMCNPLFLGTQFPEDVLTTPDTNLTALTEEQISWLHGKIDFLALDPYVSQYVSPAPDMENCMHNYSDPLWPECVMLTNVQANGWLMGDASNEYSYIAPQYFRQQLGYVWNTFRPSAILIAEFGFPEFAAIQNTIPGQLYDLQRTLYYQTFLQEMLKAIHEDGVNVIGTIAWSFMDNNEFGSFANEYGMQHVDRTNGLLTRTYKRSFFDYVDFFKNYISQ